MSQTKLQDSRGPLLSYEQYKCLFRPGLRFSLRSVLKFTKRIENPAYGGNCLFHISLAETLEANFNYVCHNAERHIRHNRLFYISLHEFRRKFFTNDRSIFYFDRPILAMCLILFSDSFFPNYSAPNRHRRSGSPRHCNFHRHSICKILKLSNELVGLNFGHKRANCRIITSTNAS